MTESTSNSHSWTGACPLGGGVCCCAHQGLEGPPITDGQLLLHSGGGRVHCGNNQWLSQATNDPSNHWAGGDDTRPQPRAKGHTSGPLSTLPVYTASILLHPVKYPADHLHHNHHHHNPQTHNTRTKHTNTKLPRF